jgi:hypothetical protein
MQFTEVHIISGGGRRCHGVCFCPSPLSQTYHIHLSSITIHYAASSHLNEGIKLLAKTKGKNLDLLVEAKEGFEFTNIENDTEPQETQH